MPLVISKSLWRKLLVTSLAIVGFVLLYEAGTFDSRDLPSREAVDPTLLPAGTRHLFSATAYCKGTTTASGVGVRTGIAASDPAILPVGSVVSVTTSLAKYNGVYTIMDTGPKVQGRLVDLYMWSCHEALAFGRRPIEITVLRLGWNPSNSVPSLVDRLFRRREATRAATLAAPPPPVTPEPDPAAGEEGDAESDSSAPEQADGVNAAAAPPLPTDAAPVSDQVRSDAPAAAPAP